VCVQTFSLDPCGGGGDDRGRLIVRNGFCPPS